MLPFFKCAGYLQRVRATSFPGPRFDVQELFPEPQVINNAVETGTLMAYKPDTKFIMDEVLDDNNRMGGYWGNGGVPGNQICLAAVYDYGQRFPHWRPADRAAATARAMDRMNRLVVESGPAAYNGAFDFSVNWDTALIGRALQDAGVSRAYLAPTASYLETQQVNKVVEKGSVSPVVYIPPGGLPFGEDLDSDVDDASEALAFWVAAGRDASEAGGAASRAARFLINMQNKDGGWAAFRHNQANGTGLLSQLMGAIGVTAARGLVESINL